MRGEEVGLGILGGWGWKVWDGDVRDGLCCCMGRGWGEKGYMAPRMLGGKG